MALESIFPPPYTPSPEDEPELKEDRKAAPEGYRWTQCPSCEEWHLRPGGARGTPLRNYPRTDTKPAPRPVR